MSDGLSHFASMEVVVIEIQQLINQLEALVNDSKRVPLSQNVMVDEEAFRRIIDQMRVSVPDIIKQAERTLGERDRIIAQAKEEASRIVHMAREQATDLVENHELVDQARDRAADMLMEAQREANAMRAEADQYALNSLSLLAEQVNRLQREVDNGVNALKASLSQD